MRLRSMLVLFAAMLGALPSAAQVPTLAPDALRPGQAAKVRTVFQGDAIEEFDAEIVGVVRGGRIDGDLILARATSERVVKSGIAQGMSGSPVYVDGRLIGALSSGWSFSREPLFGITPINDMLRVLTLPESERARGTGGPSGVDLAAPPATPFGAYRWEEESPASLGPAPAGAPGTRAAGPAPLGVPLVCGGLHAGAWEIARELFAPLGLSAVPGGRSAAAPGPVPEPGAAVAVDLLRGDMNVAAIGTLTYRDGDRVLMFGHPLFQSGEVRLPLSKATITTIVASQLTSFKIGSIGTPIGTLTQDRRAAISGTLGAVPALMPLGVDVRAAGRTERYRFASIQDRAMLPQLVSLATLNSVLETGGVGANQTLRYAFTLHRRGAAPLRMSEIAAGEAPVNELIAGIGSPLRFLVGNPFTKLELDSVSVSVEVAPGRRQFTLRTAQLQSAAVRPGGHVRVRCEVERWQGGHETVMLDVPMPEEAPSGRYVLWIGGAAELMRYEAARLPARYRPTSLEDAWARLGGLRKSDALYAVVVAQAPEVTRAGRDYPELPTSALTLLSGSQSAVEGSRRGDRALLQESRQPLDGQVRGELQLEVTVDSQAP